MSERGSSAVAMAGVLGVIAVLAVAVASVGILYGAKAQAQTAADAGALAAAVATYPPVARGSPDAVARSVIAENGSRLVSCRCGVDSSLSARTVEVVTAVGVSVPIFGVVEVGASSRAEFDPMRWLGW